MYCGSPPMRGQPPAARCPASPSVSRTASRLTVSSTGESLQGDPAGERQGDQRQPASLAEERQPRLPDQQPGADDQRQQPERGVQAPGDRSEQQIAEQAQHRRSRQGEQPQASPIAHVSSNGRPRDRPTAPGPMVPPGLTPGNRPEFPTPPERGSLQTGVRRSRAPGKHLSASGGRPGCVDGAREGSPVWQATAGATPRAPASAPRPCAGSSPARPPAPPATRPGSP